MFHVEHARPVSVQSWPGKEGRQMAQTVTDTWADTLEPTFEERFPVVESFAINYGGPSMHYIERPVSTDAADNLLRAYDAQPELFTVTRTWERVCYSVSVALVGASRPFVSWQMEV